MMTSRNVTFPKPNSADFEDVHWALTAGRSLWEQGEIGEALKWLRRAANTAAERDADIRAVELFKAAADMASLVEATGDVPQDETPTLGTEPSQPSQPSQPRQPGPPSHKAAAPARRPAAPRATPVTTPRVPNPPEEDPPTTSRRAVPRPRGARGAGPRATIPGTPRRPTSTPSTLPPAPPETRHPVGHRKVATPRPRARRISSREPRDLSPRVPPATRISERFGAFELPFDDTEEDTFIRPDTMLRRALMAIDPEYADRTEYYDDGEGPRPRFVGDLAEDDDEEDEEDEGATEAQPKGWGWDDDKPKRADSWGWDADAKPRRKDSWGWNDAVAADDDASDDASDEDEAQGSDEDDDDVDLQAETLRHVRPAELGLGDPSPPDEVRSPPETTAPPEPRATAPSVPHTAGPMPGGLLTLRVAVLPIPEEGDIRIVFLSPDEDPPPGIATALLVPPSEQDARLLAEVYADAEAKV